MYYCFQCIWRRVHFWKNPHRQTNYYLTILALKIENPFSPWGVKVKHKICTPRHCVWRRSWYAFHKCNLDLISDKRTYLYANQFWRKDWEQFPFAKYVKNLLIKDNMAGSGHPWSNQIWQTLQEHVALLNVQSKHLRTSRQSIIAPILCILPCQWGRVLNLSSIHEFVELKAFLAKTLSVTNGLVIWN